VVDLLAVVMMLTLGLGFSKVVELGWVAKEKPCSLFKGSQPSFDMGMPDLVVPPKRAVEVQSLYH